MIAWKKTKKVCPTAKLMFHFYKKTKEYFDNLYNYFDNLKDINNSKTFLTSLKIPKYNDNAVKMI